MMKLKLRRRTYVFLIAAITASVFLLAAGYFWIQWQLHVPQIDFKTARFLQTTADHWTQIADQIGEVDATKIRYITATDWPVELQRLGAREVRLTRDGIFIKFREFWVEECGLFILSRESAFEPKVSAEPSFRQLSDRVYKYDIKG